MAAEGRGRDFELSPTLAGLQPFRDKLIVVTGLFMIRQRRSATAAAIIPARAAAYLTGVHVKKSDTRRRGRHLDGPDRGQGVRARDAALVAAAADGRQQPGRILRRRLQLRVQQHALVADADAAADGREQPARRVRAAVRRQRQHRPAGPRGAAASGPQHPRFGDRSREAAAAAARRGGQHAR